MFSMIVKHSLPSSSRKAIEKTKIAHPDMPLVVVFDTFKTCFGNDPDFDESNNPYVNRKLKMMRKIANEKMVLMLLFHHFGWNSDRATGADSFTPCPMPSSSIIVMVVRTSRQDPQAGSGEG